MSLDWSSLHILGFHHKLEPVARRDSCQGIHPAFTPGVHLQLELVERRSVRAKVGISQSLLCRGVKCRTRIQAHSSRSYLFFPLVVNKITVAFVLEKDCRKTWCPHCWTSNKPALPLQASYLMLSMWTYRPSRSPHSEHRAPKAVLISRYLHDCLLLNHFHSILFRRKTTEEPTKRWSPFSSIRRRQRNTDW